MGLTRRHFIALGCAAAGLGLAACTEEAATLAISAQARSGMNPGPDGTDRPLTLTVVQLLGTSAFDGADFFALQNPATALGAELARQDQLVLAPGGSVSKTIAIQTGVAAVGVIAGFRDPSGKTFRQRIAAPASESGLIVSVGPGGLSLASA